MENFLIQSATPGADPFQRRMGQFADFRVGESGLDEHTGLQLLRAQPLMKRVQLAGETIVTRIKLLLQIVPILRGQMRRFLFQLLPEVQVNVGIKQSLFRQLPAGGRACGKYFF